MKRFHVTYDVVTPDSAEHGDVADCGFAMPGGWLFSTRDSPCGPAFEPIKADHALRLGEAIDMIGCVYDGGSGNSYYEADGATDYRTGAVTSLAFHLPHNATNASRSRIARLLRQKGLMT